MLGANYLILTDVIVGSGMNMAYSQEYLSVDIGR